MIEDITFGVPEEDNELLKDRKRCHAIFNFIGSRGTIIDIGNIFRLGEKGGRTRPIKVRFLKMTSALDALSNAPKLKTLQE